ncbi:MAG: iron-sulfur cluster carrier protein ApbC [Planctomycetota bacterium]|nr:MAG: iron-sulfur cluster carrier protein ApbC [Planctomycetota bacterium]
MSENTPVESANPGDAIRAAVGRLRDPETGRKLADTEQIGAIEVDGNRARVQIRLSTHSLPLAEDIRMAAEEATRIAAPDVQAVEIEIETLDRPPAPLGQLGLPVKSVIAVGSGKGGVGKSTVAASLALSLARSGSRVGLMDADVYGPSIPHLLGLSGRPEVVNAKIQPIYFDNIPVMSMGFLVEPDQAVIWRGPMLHGSITQFLRDTYWGQLDYLIIDMPPGTGDVALTLSQLLPLTGAVVVCTPQQVALLDAIKAISMFRKTKIPVLGMVENMSGFICPGCGKQYDIFGHGGARQKAEELGVPCLGELPLNMQMRQNSDEGHLADALDDPICAAALGRITRALVQQIADRAAATPQGPALPVL